MTELLYERLTFSPAPHFTTPAMERGTALEPAGRRFYEAFAGKDVQTVGFCASEAGPWGCSPDGLCDDRGLEIKTPMPLNLLGMLLLSDAEAAKPYFLQCQAGCWICGRQQWDLLLFSDQPGIPSRIIEIRRDDAIMLAFDEHIPAFCAELDEAEARLRKMGGGIEKPLADPLAALPDYPAQEGATL